MELRDVEIVAALADTASMNEAALQLGVSQSALSHALRRIEQRAGHPLFHRQRTLTLTPAGQIYLNYAREILKIQAQTYRSIESFSSRHSLHVSLGLSPHLDMEILMAIYESFQQKWPSVRLEAMESYSREAIDRVISGRLNVAVGIRDSDLIARHQLCFLPIQHIEYLLVIADHNPLAADGVSSFTSAQDIPSRSLSDFRDVPYIAYEKRALSSAAFTQSLFEKAGFSPLIINFTGSIAFSKSLAVSNNAYTFIPIDSMNGSTGLRCYRMAPAITVLKGYYFRPDFAITPPIADLLTMFALQMKVRYPFSSALHPTPFSIPDKYFSKPQEDPYV